MARTTTVTLQIIQHDAATDLHQPDQDLLEQARSAASRAYAPYSNFQVGAALRLADGRVVSGNNQENAAFPAGICAERTALHAAMSMDPHAVVTDMAIVVPQSKGERPVTPCGICRQVLAEQEQRQGVPVRLLLAGYDASVHEILRAGDLLPLSFDASFLTSGNS